MKYNREDYAYALALAWEWHGTGAAVRKAARHCLLNCRKAVRDELSVIVGMTDDKAGAFAAVVSDELVKPLVLTWAL